MKRVIHDDHLYWVNDHGIAYCLNAKNGEVVYKQRLSGAGGVYASAVLANNKLYVVSRQKGTFVLAAKPQFEQLANNQLQADGTVFNTSSAVTDGQLLLRSNQFLYCIERD